MTVPRLHITVPCLDESHATFDQSSSHQQLAILRSVTVELLNVLGLLRDIKCVAGFGLHAKRQLKRFDARFNDGFAWPFCQMLSIYLLQKFELL